MEEKAASRAAGFNAPCTLQREILEPGDRPVNLRQRLRQHVGEISAGDVELVMAHRQEQIAPAFRRQPLADRRHLVNECCRWSKWEAGCQVRRHPARRTDSPPSLMENGAWWHERRCGRQARCLDEKA